MNVWTSCGRLLAGGPPSRGVPHLSLEEPSPVLDTAIFDKLGIPILTRLPAELLPLVKKYSATSVAWRYSSASTFITQKIQPAAPSELFSIPLRTFSSWVRDCQPEETEDPDQLPLVCLTIDPWGISRVERLHAHPSFERWRTDSFAFVILDQDALRGITAHFKVRHDPCVYASKKGIKRSALVIV